MSSPSAGRGNSDKNVKLKYHKFCDCVLITSSLNKNELLPSPKKKGEYNAPVCKLGKFTCDDINKQTNIKL